MNRIIIFFQLWGKMYYEHRIDASFAWDLAGIFDEHSEALEDFVEVEKADFI